MFNHMSVKKVTSPVRISFIHKSGFCPFFSSVSSILITLLIKGNTSQLEKLLLVLKFVGKKNAN